MPTKSLATKSPTAVPIAFSGKWIAWDAGHQQIVASSSNLKELWVVVREQQIQDPIFEKVPRADARLVGRR
jgi:hypothetical protein